MSLAFPEIDPVILKLYGPLQVRWYGVAYVVGIVLGFWYVKFLNKRQELIRGKAFFTTKVLDEILLYAVVGIVVGGRVGYVLAYDIEKLLVDPSFIFKTWQGGMSFHGGLLGVVISLAYVCVRNKLPWRKVADYISGGVPFGIFFGRIANFINGELYGRVTDVWWAVRFPAGGYLPRHPSQLYEAFGEGLLLGAILIYLQLRSDLWRFQGVIFGVFLFGYGVVRLIVEQFREPNYGLDSVLFGLTMGQVLSLPMVILGIGLILFPKKAP